MRYAATCVVLLLIAMCIACGGVDSAAVNDRSAEARVIGQDFVRQALVNPHDASFDWGARCDPAGENTWRVSGTVKAKNNLGATLTRKYSAVVRYDAATNKWHSVSVSIDGN